MKSKATAILLGLFLATVAYAQEPASQPAAQPTPAATSAPVAAPAAASAPTTAPAPAAPEKAAESATAAPAKDTQTQAWWKALVVFLIELSKALIVPILIVLGWAANRKWNLGLERDSIEWVVSKATGYGEQIAKKALMDGKPMEGPAIFKAALEHGEGLLITKGLAKKWGDKLGDLIEAKLGEQEMARTDRESKTAEGVAGKDQPAEGQG